MPGWKRVALRVLDFYGWQPPDILRHVIPWGLLYWIDPRLPICWTGVVMWKLGYGWSWACSCSSDDEITHHVERWGGWVCYCGKFDDPREYRAAALEELARRRET